MCGTQDRGFWKCFLMRSEIWVSKAAIHVASLQHTKLLTQLDDLSVAILEHCPHADTKMLRIAKHFLPLNYGSHFKSRPHFV